MPNFRDCFLLALEIIYNLGFEGVIRLFRSKMVSKLKIAIISGLLVWCFILGYIGMSLEWITNWSGTNTIERHSDLQFKAVNDGIELPEFKYQTSNKSDSTSPIAVVMAGDKNTFPGLIAAINSIVTNTKRPLQFYLTTPVQDLPQLRSWISNTKLSKIAYTAISFPMDWIKGKIKIRKGRPELSSPMNYARFYVTKLFPKLKNKAIFLDNDVIVQDDIAELFDTPISDGHYGAFSEDCKSVSKRLNPIESNYASYINFKNSHIKMLNMSPGACSFNTGVFVANITKWRKENISEQLEYWMDLNTREDIYGNEQGDGGSQPPMMIVFYKKISPLDPLWHVRHLGVMTGSRYSRKFLHSAKLLHWNGHFKPWGIQSAFVDLWERYFIPDPSENFQLVRKNQRKAIL